MPLADLMPVLHAKDVAQAKVAAIGAINPRRGGITNAAIQTVKRGISRGLGWFVRDQVIFNQSVITCVDALMESVNEVNRSLVAMGEQLGGHLAHNRQGVDDSVERIRESVRTVESRVNYLAANVESRVNQLAVDGEALRRSVTPLPEKWDQHVRDVQSRVDMAVAAAEQRALVVESHEREVQRTQHREFSQALELGLGQIQKQLWNDTALVKLEFERLIHAELRVVRQRGTSASGVSAAPALDYPAFADRFRGSADYVRGNQEFYVERFRGVREVVDLGCGNGEFLDVMREAGIAARGVDASAESVEACQKRGLNVEQGDLFRWLDSQTDRSLAAIFCSQVIEHLPPARVPELVNLCAAKLERGALIAFETPNPECLAIFATHFYLDPTHTRPVPSALMAFYLREAGMGAIDVEKRFPASDYWPELNELPASVRDRFFGGLDYSIFGRKL